MIVYTVQKLDILVNNAGILEMGSIENTSLEQVKQISFKKKDSCS